PAIIGVEAQAGSPRRIVQTALRASARQGSPGPAHPLAGGEVEAGEAAELVQEPVAEGGRRRPVERLREDPQGPLAESGVVDEARRIEEREAEQLGELAVGPGGLGQGGEPAGARRGHSAEVGLEPREESGTGLRQGRGKGGEGRCGARAAGRQLALERGGRQGGDEGGGGGGPRCGVGGGRAAGPGGVGVRGGAEEEEEGKDEEAG